MSTASEITRLTNARNTLRTKAIALGIGTSSDKLDDLATAYDGIVDRGAVSATIHEGESYTIPAGYHNGSGTVAAVSGGGNYNLQSKTVTPTKQQQSVAPDQGYYGLSGVTVNAIPAAYQDVQSVTATAAQVLANAVFVESDGTVTVGSMVNNGTIAGTIDGLTNTSYAVPQGYHSGSGTVSLTNDIELALAAI